MLIGNARMISRRHHVYISSVFFNYQECQTKYRFFEGQYKERKQLRYLVLVQKMPKDAAAHNDKAAAEPIILTERTNRPRK